MNENNSNVAVLEKPIHNKKPINQVLKGYTEREKHIINRNAEGISQTIIANELNISQPAVSKQLLKPEIKELSQRLREALQKRHVHKFIARVTKAEKMASKVNDYALGLSDDNPTRYESIEDQEKFLARMDKTGLAIAKGVGILDTNTIRFGDDNSQNITVVSPAFQQYIDYQSNNPDNTQAIDTKGDNVDDDE